MSVKLTLTGTSPSSPSTDVLSGNPSKLTGLSKYAHLNIVAVLTGATGGVLDVYLQTSFDGGTTWYDYAHFTQISAGAAAARYSFSVSRSAQQLTVTAIGTNLTPSLAANTVLGGEFGDEMRVLCVAGASTSAGATQTILINASRSN